MSDFGRCECCDSYAGHRLVVVGGEPTVLCLEHDKAFFNYANGEVKDDFMNHQLRAAALNSAVARGADEEELKILIASYDEAGTVMTRHFREFVAKNKKERA